MQKLAVLLFAVVTGGAVAAPPTLIMTNGTHIIPVDGANHSLAKEIQDFREAFDKVQTQLHQGVIAPKDAIFPKPPVIPTGYSFALANGSHSVNLTSMAYQTKEQTEAWQAVVLHQLHEHALDVMDKFRDYVNKTKIQEVNVLPQPPVKPFVVPALPRMLPFPNLAFPNFGETEAQKV